LDTVGKALSRCFSSSHQVFIYDKFSAEHGRAEQAQRINSCGVAFIAVPTPAREGGQSCDISAVREVAQWITVPLCIKSTVPPGTTENLSSEKRPAGFSPEYIGGRPNHPWKHVSDYGFVIVGGPSRVCELVIRAYESCLGSTAQFLTTDARTAELGKYLENCFLATKVAFVNQFFDIAKAFKVDFDELRNLWLVDPRIGHSHTVVTEQCGFRGECLPKDLRAIIAAVQSLERAPLLEAIDRYNRELCERQMPAGSLPLHDS
jgi:UDPglucose 6-dehydrogenase